jgi:hypothetical protein
MKVGNLLIVLIIMSIMIIPIFTLNTSAESQTYQLYYQKYISLLYIQQKLSQPIGTSLVIYYTSSAIANISGKGAVRIDENRTLYTIITGSIQKYQGYINVSVKNGLFLTLTTNIPQLARVILVEGNNTELIWAGLDSKKITSYVYINSSAKLILQFLNGTNFVNVSFDISANSNVSKQISLNLVKITAQTKFSERGSISVQLNFPRKYSPIIFHTNLNNTNISSESNSMKIVKAYFNGTLFPAIVWRGEGLGSFAITGIGETKVNVNSNFTTITFYGVNGTAVAYVHLSTVYGSLHRSSELLESSANLFAGEVKIVINPLSKYSKPKALGSTEINGRPVIIIINDKDEVESTADVNMTHKVDVNGVKGILVNVNVNGSGKFVVVLYNNESHDVETVKAIVKNASINIGGKLYQAQNVTVNSTSKYIIFNISILSNTSIQVLKVVNGKLVPLNSSNYFIMNNKIVVFDDPVYNYVVVYGAPTITQTSAGTTISSAGGGTYQSSSISTPVPQSSNMLYIVLGIITVIIILGIVIYIIRRR